MQQPGEICNGMFSSTIDLGFRLLLSGDYSSYAQVLQDLEAVEATQQQTGSNTNGLPIIVTCLLHQKNSLQ